MKTHFRSYAWAVLVFHLAVVVWGAFVRASGSGAGCGERWPLCNGQIVPRVPLTATVIEFSHRLTSGVALVSVVALAIWAYRLFPKGHGVQRSAMLALVCTIMECAIGAALVLLHMVAANASFSRGLWLAAHLMNTLFLLATLSVTAWLATINRRPSSSYQQLRSLRQVFGLHTAGFVLSAILGGFAALGDTLAVSTSLTESIRADFSPFSNIFVRLRILHPMVAGALGICLLLVAFRVAASSWTNALAKRLSAAMAVLVILQCSLGVADITLKTPTWLQLLHLLTADLLWIVFVFLAVELSGSARRVAPEGSACLPITMRPRVSLGAS
ncbi:MAG TPA: COX15/CtaA family protein [Bryobacteraceae bacterium]|nr:COX15/CtaA family protein [Bryobacteraceae bacterium]